ncbi:MAG TPA: methyltransferase domain-containing protein [Candidatus Limnocylindrales bacterium]
MCNASGIAFGERHLTAAEVQGRDVLEVGAFDVNGSVRPHVEALKPRSYLGVDIAPGPRVDLVLDAGNLVARFGEAAFDLVITTEMVEHVRDWRTIVRNLKGVLRPGGSLLLTTRSIGFPYHGWPHDFWRYEPDDMRAIFADMEILALEPDSLSPGVFVFARRPEGFVDRTPALALHSMVSGRRQPSVSGFEIARFRARTGLAAIAGRLRPLAGWVRAPRPGLRARVVRPAWRGIRRRIVRPAWSAMPVGIRRAVKRAAGRG